MSKKYELAAEHFNNSEIVLIDADDTLWSNYEFYERLKSEMSDVFIKGGLPYQTFRDKIDEIEPNRANGEISYSKAILSTLPYFSQDEFDHSKIVKIVNKFLNVNRLPFSGSRDALESLACKKVLYIYTMGPKEEQYAKLVQTGLADLFKDIISVHEKDVTALKMTILKLNSTPGRVSLIGDSLTHDILPSADVLPSVLWLCGKRHNVRNTDMQQLEIPKNVFKFDTLDELVAILHQG